LVIHARPCALGFESVIVSGKVAMVLYPNSSALKGGERHNVFHLFYKINLLFKYLVKKEPTLMGRIYVTRAENCTPKHIFFKCILYRLDIH
jgi:hypothetical protein